MNRLNLRNVPRFGMDLIKQHFGFLLYVFISDSKQKKTLLLTWFAFIDLDLAQFAGIAVIAWTCKWVVTIDTCATIARWWLTIIDIYFAWESRVTWRAFASIAGYGIMANAIVSTRLRHTIIDIRLTTSSSKSYRASTFETIYTVQAGSAV